MHEYRDAEITIGGVRIDGARVSVKPSRREIETSLGRSKGVYVATVETFISRAAYDDLRLALTIGTLPPLVWRLLRRASYGGRKGRRAIRRLAEWGNWSRQAVERDARMVRALRMRNRRT